MRHALPLVLALSACAAKPVPPAAPAADDGTREAPGPLPAEPFVMPTVQEGTLSNGVPVRVVTNREVPLFGLSLVFQVGRDHDPEGKEGLGSVTFDLMTEGAAGLDAIELAKRQKQLGGSVGSSAGADTATLSVGGPTKNLEPLLDLMAKVMLEPEFPEEDWALLKQQRIAGLKNAAEDPTAIAADVNRVVIYGDAYTGRLFTEAAYEAMSTDDMRAYHARALDPSKAMLFAGGDIDLDTLVPLLDEALADWTAPAEPFPVVEVAPTSFDREVIYLVDSPGAAQSVLRAALPVRGRDAEGWTDLSLGATALGGAFTARVNMNLREDKGYTYGARCSVYDGTAGGMFYCSTSVQADATAPALAELRKEVLDVVGDRPLTEDEVAYFKGNKINSFYSGYELPNSLLGALSDIWLHDLPADWLERYVPAHQAVTVASANAALAEDVDTDRIAWIVVGDVEAHGEAIEALGLPVVRLGPDGQPLE